jgi:tape measure domain-containing protein
MAVEDAVVIDIQTRGGPTARRELTSDAAAVRALGRASSIAGAGFANLRQNINMGQTAAYAMRRTAYVTGVAVAGIGALAVKSGIGFNATMEQNRVALGRFLGSTQAATRELSFLYDLAAKTPFETQNITAAAQSFLAVGFSVKQTNSWVKTLGDTIAAIPNAGPQQIQQLTNALGQIQSKGRLQGDELMQLSELGILNRRDLARRLGVTPEALSSGTLNVSSGQGLAALQGQFNARFGGMGAAQSRTFSGQMSTLHDNVNMALGSATMPLFDQLRRRVLPALNASSSDINRIMGRGDLSMGDKLGMSESVLRRRLKPFADELGHSIERANIPQHLGEEFGKAAPYVAGQVAHGVFTGLKGAGTAWLHAGPWAQVGSLVWLGFKSGAAKGLLDLGKDRLLGRGSPTNPMYVVPLGGGMPGTGGGKGWLSKLGGGAAAFAGTAAARAGGAVGAFILGSGLAAGPFGSDAGLSPAEERRRLQSLRSRQRAIPNNSRGRFLGQITVVHSHVYLNGKEIAGAVAEEARDAAARRGR